MCTSCTGGNLLPLNPLDIESDWKCESCDCNVSVSNIDCRLENLMTKLEACETIPEIEAFISENQGFSVHPNHWIITEAENVFRKERARSSELSIEEQDKRIKYCSHLLSVKNIVAPGLSLERGMFFNLDL